MLARDYELSYEFEALSLSLHLLGDAFARETRRQWTERMYADRATYLSAYLIGQFHKSRVLLRLVLCIKQHLGFDNHPAVVASQKEIRAVVKGGGILYRRGGDKRSRVALQNRTPRRLP